LEETEENVHRFVDPFLYRFLVFQFAGLEIAADFLS
jgi:hypothetical protein